MSDIPKHMRERHTGYSFDRAALVTPQGNRKMHKRLPRWVPVMRKPEFAIRFDKQYGDANVAASRAHNCRSRPKEVGIGRTALDERMVGGRCICTIAAITDLQQST